MDTTWFDSVLASASNVGSSVIDAWGRVQVAQLDAQAQPPRPVQYTLPQVFGQSANYSMLIIAGIAIVGIFMVMKK